MNISTATAQALVAGLLAAGVRDVVVSPGSRSAPLTYAVGALAAAERLRVHVRIDERDAAFTALGIAKAGRLAGAERPVAVVTTSGSAVANLHPAVLEAAYQHLPLIAVTADRPARLRGTGANQTIDAQHLVLSDVRLRADLAPGDGADAWQECARRAVGVVCGDLPADPVAGAGDPAEAVSSAAAPLASVSSPERLSGAGSSPTGAASAGAAAMDAVRAHLPGPVQVNAQFDVPLTPDPEDLDRAAALGTATTAAEADGTPQGEAQAALCPGAFGAAARAEASAPALAAAAALLRDPDQRCAIIAGDDLGFGDAGLAALAEETGTPVFAEPSSSLARSSQVVSDHAAALSSGRFDASGLTGIVVTGRPTLSRPIAALLARTDLTQVVIPYGAGAPAEEWPAGGAQAGGWPAGGAQEGSENAVSENAAGSASVSTEGRGGLTAESVAAALLARPGLLVAASSNSVRALARAQRPEHPARVIASRGLAGIDGLISTASGAALAVADTGGVPGHPDAHAPVRLLIGDLAALHDLGGLLIPSLERVPRLQIVVLNDDGGAIFAGLEHSEPHLAPYFERFFTTPHGRGFADLAAGLGWDHECAETLGELESALDADGVDADARDAAGRAARSLIEVRLG